MLHLILLQSKINYNESYCVEEENCSRVGQS